MTHAKPRPFTLDELRAYLVEVFPQIWSRGHYAIEEVGPMSATVRLHYHPDHLRPGGTISGPSMFALGDLALYVAILHEIGRVKLAVTTNVSINFLRKPEPGDLIARARLLKLGQAPGDRGGRALFARRGGDGRPRDGHLFDPGARGRCMRAAKPQGGR